MISVVTICFNDVGGLKRTIDSYGSQVYSRSEHLIIDGRSTDGTINLLKSYTNSPNGKRVRIVSEPDRGIYDAMNKGLDLAHGDLIVYMNSGDCFYDTEVLAFVARQWRSGQWQWGYGGARYLAEDGSELKAYFHAPFSMPHLRLGLKWIPHQATFMYVNFVRSIGGFSESFGSAGDAELALRMAVHSVPVTWVRLLADFSVGGVHERVSVLHREMLWHRMRKANGLSVYNDPVDLMLSAGLAAARCGALRAGRSLRRHD